MDRNDLVFQYVKDFLILFFTAEHDLVRTDAGRLEQELL